MHLLILILSLLNYLDTVNVDFIISLNKKVYINRITISGNTRTQDVSLEEKSVYQKEDYTLEVFKGIST